MNTIAVLAVGFGVGFALGHLVGHHDGYGQCRDDVARERRRESRERYEANGGAR